MLNGKSALVTGGSTGIGYAVAASLADAGASVTAGVENGGALLVDAGGATIPVTPTAASAHVT